MNAHIVYIICYGIYALYIYTHREKEIERERLLERERVNAPVCVYTYNSTLVYNSFMNIFCVYIIRAFHSSIQSPS